MLTAEFLEAIALLSPLHPPRPEPAGIPELVGQAFDEMAGLPSLEHAVVPGDQVVVAVVEPVPQLRLLLPLLADRILKVVEAVEPGETPESGEPEPALTFLFAPAAWPADPAQIPLATDFSRPVAVVKHEPERERQLALLATSGENEPLSVNRFLFDADVVLLLSSAEGQSPGRRHSGVHPAFSSTAGIRHFHSLSPPKRDADQAQIDRLLGILFEISVLGEPGGKICGIRCGDSAAVQSEVPQRVAGCWTLGFEEPGDLVVATVESPSGKSAWEDIRRALLVADRLAAPEQPIVLLTDVSRKPPRRIAQALQQTAAAASGFEPEDPLSAALEVVARRPVFLSSHLSQAEVEHLGFGFLQSARELRRLIQHSLEPRLVRDAHRCSVPVSPAPDAE